MIPGACEVVFNFRYNPGWKTAELEREVHAVLDRHGLEYDIRWHRGGEPFLTGEGKLRATLRQLMRDRCGVEAEESTGGGTSDARFIAPLGAQCIEIGPVNASIHKVDECVSVAELEALPGLYGELIEAMLLD